MFKIFDFLKKNFRKKAEEDENKAEKDENEQEFMDNLGRTINKRRDRESQAYDNLLEEYGSLEDMTEAELSGLIYKEAKRIGRTEEEEDLKRKRSLRTIKTLRTKEEIKNAQNEGLKLLEEKVKPSEKIRVTDVYIRDTDTGEVFTMPNSYSAILRGTQENTKIIKEVTHYPYEFPSEVAAYVLPDDLEKGERVVLEDLIEDIVGASHSSGTYRLESAEAVWDGEKFIVQRDSYDVDITFG